MVALSVRALIVPAAMKARIWEARRMMYFPVRNEPRWGGRAVWQWRAAAPRK